MPRGGRRQGTPGVAYPNRTDLNDKPRQPVRTATGQAYGAAGAQAAAQRAVPLPQQAPPPAPVPFDAPTARPSEPVTAGLPVGAGPGPEALGVMGDDTIAMQLRALYQAYPNSELRALIEELES